MENKVLFIDDEKEILNAIQRHFINNNDEYYYCNSAAKGMELIKMHEFSVVVADMHMPEMNGVEFLWEVQKMSPDTVRIILSGNSDIFMLIEAINAGKIWQYIAKPWCNSELQITINNAIDLFNYKKSNDKAFKDLASSNSELEKAVKKSEFLTAKLEQANATLEHMVYQKTKELQQVNQRLMIMDKTKNDFLRLLSHEMRTPLNGIFGIMDIVFDQITKNDGNTQLYKHFANSRERILRIIDDSLMLAKFELYENGENMAVYPLKQIISEAIVKSRSLATEKKISLNLKNVFYETDIKSDKNMLIKALQSYIMSLVNISNPGRTIDISIEKNSNIQIILMLQGEKLSESFISSFFEIFVTNDTLCPGGYWGLESALGYRIISMLNGKTTIENRDPDSVCLIVEPNSN